MNNLPPPRRVYKKRRFATVKSVITLTILAVFVFMVLKEQLPVEFTTGIISMVLTYYFTKSDDKKEGENNGWLSNMVDH